MKIKKMSGTLLPFRTSLTSLFLLLLTVGCLQNKGEITGQIFDTQNNPVPGAVVVTEPSGYTATTDADGMYTINDVPVGDYTVKVTSGSYAASVAALVKEESFMSCSPIRIVTDMQLAESTGGDDDGGDGGLTGSCSVSFDVDSNEAVLENSVFKCSYTKKTFDDGNWDHVITELLIKGANNENQSDEQLDGVWMNSDTGRGNLTGGSVTYDGTDRKTLRLEWSNGPIQEITIYPDKPVIKIDYISYGINIVDIGAPGGGSGSYVFYGADTWIREYTSYPDSYLQLQLYLPL